MTWELKQQQVEHSTISTYQQKQQQQHGEERMKNIAWVAYYKLTV